MSAPITIACLDLAGTTVRDDGIVMDAFTSAIAGQALSADEYDQAMKDVRASMGRSKIEVFRRVLGDEGAALDANRAFEQHYAAAVRAGDARRADRRAGLAVAHRPGPVTGGRGTRPSLAGPPADRAAAARRRRGQRTGRHRGHAQRHRIWPPGGARAWWPLY